MSNKIENITKALDDFEGRVIQWIYEFDGWIATTFRQYPVYYQQGHPVHNQTDDPAYNSYFGSQNPILAPTIVGAGALAGIIGVVYSIWNAKQERKWASTDYFMHQIKNLYKGVDEKTPEEINDDDFEKAKLDYQKRKKLNNESAGPPPSLKPVEVNVSGEIKEADNEKQKPERVNKKYAYKIFAKTAIQLQHIAQSNGVDKDAKQLLTSIGVRRQTNESDEAFANLEALVTEYQDLYLVYDCLYSGFSRGFRKWYYRKKLNDDKYKELLEQYEDKAASEDTNKKALEKALKDKFAAVRDALYIRTGKKEDWNNELRNPIQSAKARMTKLYNGQRPGPNGEEPLQDIDLELKLSNGKWIAELAFKEKNGESAKLKPGKFKIPARVNVEETEEAQANVGASEQTPLSPKPKPPKTLDKKMDELPLAPQAQGIWRAGFHYSYAYWIAWFIAWAITSVTLSALGLSAALTFGIPAIIPGVILTWTIGKWCYKKIDYLLHPEKKQQDIDAANKAQEQIELEKAEYEQRHLFKKSLFSECYNNERRQEIKAKNYQVDQFAAAEGMELVIPAPTPTGDVAAPAAELPELAKDLQSKWSERGRIARTAISNVSTGYLLTFFFFWPFQDLASLLVSTDTLVKAGLAILDPYGFAVELTVAILGLVVGGVFALYHGSKEHTNYIDGKKLIAEKEVILKNLSEELQTRDKLLEQSNKLNQDLKTLLKEFDQKGLTAEEKQKYKDFFKPADFIPSIDENDKVWKQYDPTVAKSKWEKTKSFVDNAFDVCKHVVFDMGTGSLLVRTLFQAGLVAGSVLVGSAFWPVGLSMAVLWTGYKLYDAYKQKQLRHQQTYVKEAEARLHEVKKENNALKEQITVQQKQIALLKGIKAKHESPKQENGTTVAPTVASKLQLPDAPECIKAKVSVQSLFKQFRKETPVSVESKNTLANVA